MLLFATLGLLWFILCRNLSLEWSSNEQYSYGWFVPFFAAFLFWLRWESWPAASGYLLSVNGSSDSAGAAPRTNNKKLITIGAIIALAIIAPIRLFQYANPDWRPLSWLHALAVVGLTLMVIGYWGGKAAVRHFGFPVSFILVAVPWLTPIEAPLVQWLMRIVAAVATETLTLFGIPAQLEGSLIRVNNGVVGVSEACSGVRSLQTSLMIGLLFGELKRLTISRRVALVGAALAIALLANFGRALFLVWIAASQDLAAVEKWHDIAGFAIVGAVFVGTIAIASALAKAPGSARASRALSGASPDSEESSSAEDRRQRTENGNATAQLALQRPTRPPLHLPPNQFQLFSPPQADQRFSFDLASPRRSQRHRLVSLARKQAHPRTLLDRGMAGERARFRGSSDRRSHPGDVALRRRPAGDLEDPANREAGDARRLSPGTAGAGLSLFLPLGTGHRRPSCARGRTGPTSVCPRSAGPSSDSRRFARIRWAKISRCRFNISVFVHDDPGGRPVYAETFFCLREDRVRAGSGRRCGDPGVQSLEHRRSAGKW